MKTAEINAALALLLAAFSVTIEKYAVVYSNAAGAAVRVTYSAKAEEYRVANAVDNKGGYFHHNPANVAGAIARRLA